MLVLAQAIECIQILTFKKRPVHAVAEVVQLNSFSVQVKKEKEVTVLDLKTFERL